jgi:hypothetical protein
VLNVSLFFCFKSWHLFISRAVGLRTGVGRHGDERGIRRDGDSPTLAPKFRMDPGVGTQVQLDVPYRIVCLCVYTFLLCECLITLF